MVLLKRAEPVPPDGYSPTRQSGVIRNMDRQSQTLHNSKFKDCEFHLVRVIVVPSITVGLTQDYPVAAE